MKRTYLFISNQTHHTINFDCDSEFDLVKKVSDFCVANPTMKIVKEISDKIDWVVAKDLIKHNKWLELLDLISLPNKKDLVNKFIDIQSLRIKDKDLYRIEMNQFRSLIISKRKEYSE